MAVMRDIIKLSAAWLALSVIYVLLNTGTCAADYYGNGLRYLYQYSYAPLQTGQFRLYYTGTYGTQQIGNYILPNSTYLQQAGVSYGATEHVDIEVYSTMPVGQSVQMPYAGGGSLRYYQATDYVDIAGLADYHMDWTGTSIDQLTLVLSKTMGRLNMTANGTAQHAFAAHKDAIDMYFNAGVSYVANRFVNFGIESQGSDLEATFTQGEAEGGASFILSPVMVFTSADINLLFGPGIEIKNGITSQLIRAALTKTF